MNKKNPLQIQAVQLRKQGLSYSEIRKCIPVAKSTLSLWLKNISLEEKHRKRLYTKRISFLSLGSQSQKERRAREIEKIITEAKQEILLPVSFETHRLMGAALYWAEGSKTRNFDVTNSDPYFILFMVRWLKAVFNIPAASLKARLNIYPQQNETEIKEFWSALTGIPVKNFGKSYVKPISTGYKSNNLYYGTMRIEVPRGTDMRHRVFGWLQVALGEIEPVVNLTKRRWISLKEVARPVNLL